MYHACSNWATVLVALLVKYVTSQTALKSSVNLGRLGSPCIPARPPDIPAYCLANNTICEDAVCKCAKKYKSWNGDCMPLNYGCPAAQDPLLDDQSEPVPCNFNPDSCPEGYTCAVNFLTGARICCGELPYLCPAGFVAASTSYGTTIGCSIADTCPRGFSCIEHRSMFRCCRSLTQPTTTTTTATPTVEPVVQTVAQTTGRVSDKLTTVGSVSDRLTTAALEPVVQPSPIPPLLCPANAYAIDFKNNRRPMACDPQKALCPVGFSCALDNSPKKQNFVCCYNGAVISPFESNSVGLLVQDALATCPDKMYPLRQASGAVVLCRNDTGCVPGYLCRDQVCCAQTPQCDLFISSALKTTVFCRDDTECPLGSVCGPAQVCCLNDTIRVPPAILTMITDAFTTEKSTTEQSTSVTTDKPTTTAAAWLPWLSLNDNDSVVLDNSYENVSSLQILRALCPLDSAVLLRSSMLPRMCRVNSTANNDTCPELFDCYLSEFDTEYGSCCRSNASERRADFVISDDWNATASAPANPDQQWYTNETDILLIRPVPFNEAMATTETVDRNSTDRRENTSSSRNSTLE